MERTIKIKRKQVQIIKIAIVNPEYQLECIEAGHIKNYDLEKKNTADWCLNLNDLSRSHFSKIKKKLL